MSGRSNSTLPTMRTVMATSTSFHLQGAGQRMGAGQKGAAQQGSLLQEGAPLHEQLGADLHAHAHEEEAQQQPLVGRNVTLHLHSQQG